MNQLENYFNITLRNALKYSEYYKISFTGNKIILTSSGPSSLLQMIKNDVKLKEDLIKQLYQFLVKMYPQNKLKEVYLTTHGLNPQLQETDITINMIFEQTELYKLPAEIFSIIFSYTQAEEVKNFEQLPEFNYVYNNTEFWVNLFIIKFSEYLRSEVRIDDYKDFYYGMNEYTKFKDKVFNGRYKAFEAVFKLYDKYPKVIKYLLRTNQLELPTIRLNKRRQISTQLPINKLILHIDDVDLFKMYRDDFYPDDEDEIGEETAIMIVYEDVLSDNNLGPNIFDYIYKLSGHSDNFEQLSSVLFMLSDSDNTELIKYIIEKLPETSKTQIHNFLREAAGSGLESFIIRELWEKYKHLFSSKEILDLNEVTVNNYYETGYESVINIFGDPKAEIDEGFDSGEEDE